MRRLKPVNTGSHKHVTEMLKNAEKNPRPSSDLIPSNMQSRHAPEEPQQPGSVIFSAFDIKADFPKSGQKCRVSQYSRQQKVIIPEGIYWRLSALIA